MNNLESVIGAVVLLTIIKLVVNVASLRSMSVILLLLVCGSAHATTTVTVDNNDKVTVTQPSSVVQTVVTPVVITRETMVGDFEGRIVNIDYSRYVILVYDTNGNNREIAVQPGMINNYRVGDYVLVHPTTDLTLVTMQENPRDFEGEIIRVDISRNEIVVQDTNGRERRVQMKQGMIGTYKVDDYVRIHLMADLKEAKTIETIRDIRNLEGNIVSVDSPSGRVIVRSADGKDNVVLVRQTQIHNYKAGDNVRVYLLADREQVQVIRVIR